MGKEVTKSEGSTKAHIQEFRRLTLLNLFYAISTIMILRFLGEKVGLPTVWYEGKCAFPIGKERTPER